MNSRYLSLIKKIFPVHKSRYLFLFTAALLQNFFAALLEGLSFALILLALTVLSEGIQIDFSRYPVLSSPFFLKKLEGLEVSQVFTLFIILAVLAQILRSSLTYIAQTIATILAMKLQTKGQKKVYQQILRFSFPCVSLYKVGDLVEYVNVPSQLIPILIDGLNRILSSGLAICALVGMMFFISTPLTVLAIIIFGFLAFSQKFIIYRLSLASKVYSNSLVEFNKQTVQNLYGLRAIHVFNRQDVVLQEISLSLDQVAKATRKISIWVQSIPFINEVMGVILIGGFLFVGQWVIHAEKRAMLSILLTFVTIVYRLNSRIQIFLAGVTAIAGNWGRILRFEEILNDENKQFTLTGERKIFSFERTIAFHDVSLLYPSTREHALNNVNLTISKGSTVAFIGASGAGKSSIMDLLLRLYDPTSGFISVDDIPLHEFDSGSWRDYLGVVSQDVFIFNETIANNIRFGKLNASNEEIIQAAKAAGIHSFIASLPEGYKTVLGEKGYRLSGGEKQRIALARAFVRNSKILILDEATSSLDTHSERLIQKSLEKYRGHKTVIVVAHRLSTVINADKIIVLNKGFIVESGSHAELLAGQGIYASFWQAQSQTSFQEI